MGEEETATLEGQFYEFAKYLDTKRDGSTITLYRSDYWMRQAKIIDDRKLTMTDTGITFNKFSKSELNWEEWNIFLKDLCELKDLDEEKIRTTLTNCGLPGQTPVVVPHYRDFFLTYKPKEKDAVYCNATFDSYLCWPPTQGNTLVRQSCPRVRLSDPSNFAYRICGGNGLWLGRRNESSVKGWTNFTPCFPTELQSLFIEVFDSNNRTQTKYDVANYTRILELVGYSVSAIALIVSLFIFSKFRVLRNQRTLVHKCMFWTLLAQALIRITIYIDQIHLRSSEASVDSSVNGIENVHKLCIASYIVLEYCITAMFVWHLIEGFYLYDVVTRSVMRPNLLYKTFFLAGWGVPAIITLVWALANGVKYRQEKIKTCWYGYNFHPLYWICQAPRIAVIAVNFFFLVNIMITVVRKLKRLSASELQRTSKAVKAGFILIPLLGIPNILNMIEIPMTVSFWEFALWSYTTHFIRSSQGFFICVIYCFRNNEVIDVLGREWRNLLSRWSLPGINLVGSQGLNPTPSAPEMHELETILHRPEQLSVEQLNYSYRPPMPYFNEISQRVLMQSIAKRYRRRTSRRRQRQRRRLYSRRVISSSNTPTYGIRYCYSNVAMTTSNELLQNNNLEGYERCFTRRTIRRPRNGAAIRRYRIIHRIRPGAARFAISRSKRCGQKFSNWLKDSSSEEYELYMNQQDPCCSYGGDSRF